MKAIKNTICSVLFTLICMLCYQNVVAQSTPGSGGFTCIRSFSMANISNTNTWGSNVGYDGYSDFTSQTVYTVEQGVYPVSIVFGNLGVVPSAHSIYGSVKIWIDYNDDFNFDQSEQIQFVNAKTYSDLGFNYMGSFENRMSDFVAIPSGNLGLHTMRVRYMDNLLNFQADNDYQGNGETEDYSIFILPQSCSTSAPVLGPQGIVDADVLMLSNAPMQNAALSATVDFGANSFTCGYIQWYYAIGDTYPLSFIEIPNSNSPYLNFVPPVSGPMTFMAVGMIGTPEVYFLARPASCNVLASDNSSGAGSGSTISGIKRGVRDGIAISFSAPEMEQEAENERNTSTENQQIEKENPNFQIYPNPCMNTIRIQNDSEDASFSVSMFDIQGNELPQVMPVFSQLAICQMNTENLAPGVYLLKVVSNDNVSFNRIVKTASN